MSQISVYFSIATIAFTLYYVTYNVLFLVILIRASTNITDDLRWPVAPILAATFANPLTPKVSIVVPAHNEEAGIIQAVEALQNLRYPSVEIIVIDDGSTDRTFELLERAHGLKPTHVSAGEQITQIGETIGIYSAPAANLIVLRKRSVGRRSDAINAGLRIASNELVCMIDGDSLLEPDALLRVVIPFLDDPTVVGAGGVVRPSNGARVSRGRIMSLGMAASFIERIQIVEYLRAFLVGRAGWSSLNGLMIISGAFGLFRRDAVLAVGGLDPESLAEDADLVVALHKYFRDRRQPYKIVFVPEPVCWTEVPASVAVLGRQRTRWSQGLGELLSKNAGMIGNPKYRFLGIITLPFFLSFEFLGPVVGLLGLIVSVIGVVLGLIPTTLFFVFLAASLGLSTLTSLASLLIEEIAFRSYPRFRHVIDLLMATALEPFGYYQLHSWWRLKGMYYALRRHRSEWGAMTRTGFAVEQPLDKPVGDGPASAVEPKSPE